MHLTIEACSCTIPYITATLQERMLQIYTVIFTIIYFTED